MIILLFLWHAFNGALAAIPLVFFSMGFIALFEDYFDFPRLSHLAKGQGKYQFAAMLHYANFIATSVAGFIGSVLGYFATTWLVKVIIYTIMTPHTQKIVQQTIHAIWNDWIDLLLVALIIFIFGKSRKILHSWITKTIEKEAPTIATTNQK